MIISSVIDDLHGYKCSEVCPHWNKDSGCFYDIDKSPSECSEMIQRYAFDILTEHKPRLTPKEIM